MVATVVTVKRISGALRMLHLTIDPADSVKPGVTVMSAWGDASSGRCRCTQTRADGAHMLLPVGLRLTLGKVGIRHCLLMSARAPVSCGAGRATRLGCCPTAWQSITCRLGGFAGQDGAITIY